MANRLPSWTLQEFKTEFGTPKIAPFVNSQTGEQFHSLAFVSPENNITLVGFSSKMGELSAAEIKAQQHDLQIVQTASGSYKLCKVGNSTWQDVDI